ncbi:MAG: riboflavin biosynthesis protein RibF [Bacteroidaceae bacterium]
MQVIRDINKEKAAPSVATIGFFDGVHCGHRALIKQLRKIAHERGLRSMLITFPEHPRLVMNGDYKPELLSTPTEKICQLASTGVDYCVLLPFTAEIAQLSARDFMKKYLQQELGVQVLVVGYDHHFGHQANEHFDDYVNYGKELGIDVIQGDACQVDGERISSSAVRLYLQLGDMSKVERCIGAPYAIDGKVIEGHYVGHELGFPTANIDPLSIGKKIPLDGVYAVKVYINGTDYVGMLNIGSRPTIDDSSERSIEVHILNFADDLYGEELHIEFAHRLRAERKFNSREELITQLKRDVVRVESIMSE